MGALIYHSVDWLIEGWKWMADSAACAGYIIGEHRAASHDPILTATRVVNSPFKISKNSDEAMGSA